jgi:hypothetical protein
MKTKLLLIALTLSLNLFSQVVDIDKSEFLNKKVIVVLNDGEEFTGLIESIGDTDVILNTSNAKIIISKSQIKSIDIYTYMGKYLFENSNATRYFFSPSAIPIEKGAGYYQNVLLSSNFFNYGISSNFSMGGGIELISTLSGSPVFFATPKIAFQLSENWYMSTGGMFVLNTGGTISLPFLVATYGSKDNNITFGGGYLYSSGSIFDLDGNLVYTISGSARISNSISFMSENYIINADNDFGLLSLEGIRIMSKKNSFDIGLIFLGGDGDLTIAPLPFVGYQRSF